MKFNRLIGACVIGCAAVALSVQQPAFSEETKPTAEELAADELYKTVGTTVYDVRDLLFDLPDERPSSLVPPSRLGERRLSTPALRPTTQPIESETDAKVEELMTIFKESVDPDSWRDNGGSIGGIREIAGCLIVVQNAANQKEIARMLGQLRETQARMVNVHAQWVLLSADQLRAIAKPLANDPSLLGVDREALHKIDAKQKRFEGQMTCFNAQKVRITSGRARTVVTDQIPVVGTDTVGYQPVADLVQGGALLEVKPVLSAVGTTVVMSVQSVVSDWREPNTANARTAPTTRPSPEIDRIDMNVQELRTSIALPTNQPCIIGGMSFTPTDAGENDARMQLYLVIEVKGTPTPPEQEEKPVTPPAPAK